jgi:glycosyltransferase involved in cell wall biosynthesis
MTRNAVVLVSTSYPSAADGSEAAGAFVADFAAELSRRAEVRIVGPGPVEAYEPGVVPVWRFAGGDRPLSLLSPSRPADWPSIARVLRSMARQTRAACADGRVAHLLALWVLPSGWMAMREAARHGVPYSVWALGSDIWSLGRSPMVRPVLRHVARGAQAAYADGLALADDATAITGRPFAFMPSCRSWGDAPVPPKRERPPYRLLFLGRWHPNKGIDLLLDALALLDDAAWSRIGSVRIEGGGPMEALVRERCGALRAAGRPVIDGTFLDRTQAAAALGWADRLLLPSRIESIPLIFSDAMHFHLPVVAMPVGDLPGLLAHGGGWLASSVDSEAFTQALQASLHGASHALDVPPATRDRFQVGVVATAFEETFRSS